MVHLIDASFSKYALITFNFLNRTWFGHLSTNPFITLRIVKSSNWGPLVHINVPFIQHSINRFLSSSKFWRNIVNIATCIQKTVISLSIWNGFHWSPPGFRLRRNSFLHWSCCIYLVISASKHTIVFPHGLFEPFLVHEWLIEWLLLVNRCKIWCGSVIIISLE